jgi:hypothetical protein
MFCHLPSDCINTPDSAPAQPPTYPSPRTGAPVTWPEFLLLWSTEIDRLAGGGEHGLFLSTYLLGLHHQARLMGATGPADHTTKAQAEADRQAAWIRALEAEASHWELGPDPDCDLGDWGGHPDEAARQGWYVSDPADDTYIN